MSLIAHIENVRVMVLDQIHDRLPQDRIYVFVYFPVPEKRHDHVFFHLNLFKMLVYNQLGDKRYFITSE